MFLLLVLFVVWIIGSKRWQVYSDLATQGTRAFPNQQASNGNANSTQESSGGGIGDALLQAGKNLSDYFNRNNPAPVATGKSTSSPYGNNDVTFLNPLTGMFGHI